MANETGKRYTCTVCGSEMIVTKGGEGSIMCCGQPMVKKT
ncbi:MAG: desulfoferrodoxin [Chloroflexi bacterium]|nr:desulfoferrodoxin [Chloroflexota bacterium]